MWRGLGGFVALVVTLGAAPAAAGPGQDGQAQNQGQGQGSGPRLVETRLPVPSDAQGGIALDVNNRGQVVGQLSEVREDLEVISHPVLWDRGRAVDLAPHVDEQRGVARFVNDRGQVALRIDGHAAIWHRGRLTYIDRGAASSEVYTLNERGEAIVGVERADGTATIGVWRDGEIVEPTSPLGPDVPARPMVVSDGGHVGVENREPDICAPARSCPAHLWYRGSYTEFPAGQFSDLGADVVNRSGQVVGAVREGDAVLGAIRNRRGEVTSTFACPTDAVSPRPYPTALNGRGQVAGECVVAEGPDWSQRAVLWHRGEPRWLPSLGGHSYVRAFNERGDVLGESGDHQVLWSRGQVFDLGPYPGVNARALNDRSQVVGMRDQQPVIWGLR